MLSTELINIDKKPNSWSTVLPVAINLAFLCQQLRQCCSLHPLYTWAICCSLYPFFFFLHRLLSPPTEAIFFSIPKYFWSPLYAFIIYFSPTNLASLHLAFCHPMMPCQSCFALPFSLPLSLSPPSSSAPTLSPGEAALLPYAQMKGYGGQ